LEPHLTTDPIQETIDRFWETIPPVWNQIRGSTRATAAERFDLTFEQFHILRHVRAGVCSVSELAEVKQISRPAVSQAVDLLVERGLLDRRQSSGDRRFNTLALTPAGGEALDAISQHTRAWMRAQLARLPAAELEAACRGLDALKRAFLFSE
jgi:DNA-binding MarR family transcriptional regulator